MIEVKNLLDDLICEYHVEDEGSPTSASLDGNGDDFLSSISARVASRRPPSMGFRSELDRYLDEEMVNMHTKNFIVLDWWKVNLEEDCKEHLCHSCYHCCFGVGF